MRQNNHREKTKFKKNYIAFGEGTNPPETQSPLPVYIQIHIDNKTRLV